MGEKEGKTGSLSCQDKVYQEVVHIDDAEVVVLFMEKYRQDQAEALSYLSQWDYGEGGGERLAYSQIMEGLMYVNYIAGDMYLAVWQTGINGISLYRAVAEEETIMRRARMNLSEEERCMVSEGLLTLMANVNALKSILYDIEVNEALDAYIEKIKRLNDKVCQAVD